MKKKNLLIATALTITMAIPFTVFAATSDAPAAKSVRGFFAARIDPANLTDQQKADAKDFSQKMIDLKKQFINKMVANGTMTQEQADAAIKKLDEENQKVEEKGWIPGFGKGEMFDRGRGGFDKGGKAGIQLNDQQKADMTEAYNKMMGLQKELIAKMVSNGAITQDKANEITKKLDEMTQKLQQNGMNPGLGMPMGIGGIGDFGGFGMFRFSGIDESKLNDQQKADLADYTKKMADLRKETMAKMVANGAITQQQADEMNKRMENMPKPENMPKFDQGKGPAAGKGMMDRGRGMMDKGNFGKPGRAGGAGNQPANQ